MRVMYSVLIQSYKNIPIRKKNAFFSIFFFKDFFFQKFQKKKSKKTRFFCV